MSHSEQRLGQVQRAILRELRSILARRQIKLAALSTATGIPRSTLHHKLRGRTGLTVSELVLIAIALAVPAADLLETAMTAVETAGRDAGEASEPDEPA
ncbi:helix-turn-helix domain-containing protein [Nocardioides pelophilus]|uniref:helix-turn-helix domain-containing protein n=1 Tax=Nocardioides pelophilus TaxID=2172019 RepID=UPI001602ED6B|nr:helix-turn-helix transcriptional regulator [Nocardioides pelophilus]